MVPPDIVFERFLNERNARGERKYSHIIGRLAVEEYAPDHLHRWFVDWINQQLSDIGVNSTGGVALPLLRFEMVRVRGNEACAHVFESDEYTFIAMTLPMFDEMLDLSRRAVKANWALIQLQLAPLAQPEEIARLLLLMQFSFVSSHEYSHVVRQHLSVNPPLALEIGQSLTQAQEFDAEGYALYHELTYFFQGAGRSLTAQLLKISNDRVLEDTLLCCLLLSTMMQFIARWAGKIHIESDLAAEHPPMSMRIERALLVTEMWCREVGEISTSWMTDGTSSRYFQMAANLFPADKRASWGKQIAWL